MRIIFASFALRIGLAFVFVSAAISSYLNPGTWTKFIPTLVTNYIPTSTFLWTLEGFEVLLALLLLIKRRVSWVVLLAALSLLVFALANLNSFDLVFQDVGLALAALALFAIGKIKA